MMETPSGERLHIGFFGCRNAGKSSLVNAVTNQDMAVVSSTKGTTTDPVSKAMELLPIGPVMIIDTPGYDDEGTLGELRIKKTKQVLNRCDLAVLVTDASLPLNDCDRELLALFRKKQLPHMIVRNKCDLPTVEITSDCEAHLVSAKTGSGINALKEAIARLGAAQPSNHRLIGDLVSAGDFVVLVVPIDSAAPKGRLILPQQLVIRDLLDAGAVPICVKEDRITDVLAQLGKKPALVVTDSQAFEEVSRSVPETIPLTSFSILMARYKGFLETAVQGAEAITSLRPGDRVLISEGCTHHRQCDDIGTVKLPRWLKETLGFEPIFETSSGKGFPEDLTRYSLIIHCGGCMLGEREIQYRMKCAMDQGIPFTNYGTAIASMKGILPRTLAVFRENGRPL